MIILTNIMATDPATIDAYNKHAYERAKRIREGNNLPHEYIEKPAMYSLLPDLKNKKVLCIGCGTGEECNYLKDKGATVTGIDISYAMIDIAKSSYANIDFMTMDMEQLSFEPDSFDFIYSSLTFHYVQKWNTLLAKAYQVLRPSGRLLFSTQHPVTHNSAIIRTYDSTSYLLGYTKKTKDRSIEIHGDYFNNQVQDITWPGNFKISFYNRSISQMIHELRHAGFHIETLEEPQPIESIKKSNPQFFAQYTKLPLFVLILASK